MRSALQELLESGYNWYWIVLEAHDRQDHPWWNWQLSNYFETEEDALRYIRAGTRPFHDFMIVNMGEQKHINYQIDIPKEKEQRIITV